MKLSPNSYFRSTEGSHVLTNTEWKIFQTHLWERTNRLPRRRRTACCVYLQVGLLKKKRKMITVERWYLGKWKPCIAGTNHLRDRQQLSLLPGLGDICLPCLSFLEGNNWDDLYMHKGKISRKQSLATQRSSRLNNPKVRACNNSPGKAGWLLILPLNYIQRAQNFI